MNKLCNISSYSRVLNLAVSRLHSH